MVERFTITAAEQDPWVDADTNGQWVRYADYADCAAERERWIDYTIDLQRIIEALCGNRKLPQPVSSARHHYNMAERALAERAGGVKVPIGYALVPVEPTDRMVSAYVAAKPKGAGFNHPRKGDDKKAWFAAHEKKCRERWKAMLSVSALTTEPAAPEGRQEAMRIGDAVLDWMVKFDLLDAGNEYYVSDVLAVLNDLTPSTRPAEQAVTDGMVEAASEAIQKFRQAPEQDASGKRYYRIFARSVLEAALAQKEEGR